MGDGVDVGSISADPWLRRMMKVGIPLAVISIISLWSGQLMGIPGLFILFAVTGGLTLAIGLAYNVRFVLLAYRRSRE
ncbi:hypothetical protein [Aquisalimonas asiatica]|uniref:Uncharacterized protein n=1 Tax=Aquisalimonas asiatica TaxID=406100 RepID=A0A1H8Q3L5_9GAMM|nr:hypothetical protein [Aquisalimonas asiatica]SEO48799.1 hypothetical protein SAMN04488052_101331 [Aquisalimonas asiatica]